MNGPADPATAQRAAPADAPIGVFDSGIGGLSILRALRRELPQEDFVYFADTVHAPYGERDGDFVLERAERITQDLVDRLGIKLLVVACNTATAAAIQSLRARWPHLIIVGVEPALKPAAAATLTHRVGVLATRSTLASEKFAQLQASLAGPTEFIPQPCDGLAAAIEAGNAALTTALCERYLQGLGPLGAQAGAIDTLVLGCTHYAFALPDFQRLAGAQVRILETGEPVARHTWRLMAQASLLNPGTAAGRLTLQSSGDLHALQVAARHWMA
ncbi:MAG: glutamate racemase [Pseudomonadota bacterium]|jgi:glutamate racemase